MEWKFITVNCLKLKWKKYTWKKNIFIFWSWLIFRIRGKKNYFFAETKKENCFRNTWHVVWITLYSKCNAKLILTKWFLIIHPGAYFFWFEETLRNILWVFAWESNALKLIRTFKKKGKKILQWRIQWRLRFYFFLLKIWKRQILVYPTDRILLRYPCWTELLSS